MEEADKGLIKKYKNRMGMFDFIKGLAIFFVVLCHVLASFSENELVNRLNLCVRTLSMFWMASLLMASGYWMVPKKTKEYTKKIFSSFLKQYVGVGIVTLFCYMMIHYIRFRWIPGAIKGGFGVVLAFLLGNKYEVTFGKVTIYEIGPAWFLVVLCLGSIMLNIVLNTQWIRHKTLVMVLLGVFGVVLEHIVWSPYCLGPSFAGSLCLFVGYRLRQSKYLIATWRKWEYIRLVVLLLVGIVMMMFCFWAGVYGMSAELLTTIPVGIVVLRLGLLTETAKNGVVRFFRHLGRYTLWILMVHTVEMLSIDWSALTHKTFFVNHPLISLLAVLVVRWGIIAVGCMIISKVGIFLSRRKLNESAG